MYISINGVVVTWVVAIDPPGVRFPLNAVWFLIFDYFNHSLIFSVLTLGFNLTDLSYIGRHSMKQVEGFLKTH